MNDDVVVVIQFQYELLGEPSPAVHTTAARLRDRRLHCAQHKRIRDPDRNEFGVTGATLEVFEVDRQVGKLRHCL